jgi:hypothetical protein
VAAVPGDVSPTPQKKNISVGVFEKIPFSKYSLYEEKNHYL